MRTPSERKEQTMTTGLVSRRALLKKGLAGAALGAGALALPRLVRAGSPNSEQVAEIYELQAAFHRRKDDAGPRSDDVALGRRRDVRQHQHWDHLCRIQTDQVLLAGLGSFTHFRFSLVPSYKTTIQVHGDEAFLYFECHDIGNFNSGHFDDKRSSRSSTTPSSPAPSTTTTATGSSRP
jgi:hypothetical protein